MQSPVPQRRTGRSHLDWDLGIRRFVRSRSPATIDSVFESSRVELSAQQSASGFILRLFDSTTFPHRSRRKPQFASTPTLARLADRRQSGPEAQTVERRGIDRFVPLSSARKLCSAVEQWTELPKTTRIVPRVRQGQSVGSDGEEGVDDQRWSAAE